MTKPLNAAFICDEESAEYHVTDEVWNTQLDISEGDCVTLLHKEGWSIFSVPVKGTTFKDMLTAIEEGMRIKLTKEHKDIFKRFTNIFETPEEIRKQLIDKFKRGKLTIADLIGDDCFYEGGIEEISNNRIVIMME